MVLGAFSISKMRDLGANTVTGAGGAKNRMRQRAVNGIIGRDDSRE